MPERHDAGRFAESSSAVSLEELAVMLSMGTIKASVEGSVLLARHDRFTTRVEVVGAEGSEPGDRPIRAVVRVIAELPASAQSLFAGGKAEAIAGYNRMASLGALTRDAGRVYVGSRLTILEGEGSWRELHLPLLLMTVIGGTESILGAIARSMSGQGGRGGKCEWTSQELSALAREMSSLFACRADSSGVVADFGQDTGRLELRADQAHPEFGGGLLSLLSLPNRFPSAQRAYEACAVLNSLEMQARDVPPHFGAWCSGQSDHTIAYVSFLPNPLHRAPNIARHAILWARERAAWAGDQLEAMEAGTSGDGGLQTVEPAPGESSLTFIPLIRHSPSRRPFDWQGFSPDSVRAPGDLPDCLVMGCLDESSFRRDSEGWQAAWRAPSSSDTDLTVSYNFARRVYSMGQRWNGIDGGFGQYVAHAPLGQIVAKALYLQFPKAWDRAAKERLERRYQLTYLVQPDGTNQYFGVPDGDMRTVAFMAIARNLRPIRKWLQMVLRGFRLKYPFAADAQLLRQTINYVEGKAESWTTTPARCYHQSLLDTGLPADALPAREPLSDGSVAWTVRRPAYVVFLSVPFWGLEDLLASVANDNGPVRRRSAPPLRPEFLPIVMPHGFDAEVPSATWWDPAMTTRCTIEFDGFARAEETIEWRGRLVDATIDGILSNIERKSESAIRDFEQTLRDAGWGS